MAGQTISQKEEREFKIFEITRSRESGAEGILSSKGKIYLLLKRGGGRGGGGKLRRWIEFDKRVDSLTQLPSGFGYGVAVLEIGLWQGLGRKVPETVSSGITVFTNSLLLPNPGVDYAIIYTDTRGSFVSFRFVSFRRGRIDILFEF